MFSQIFRSLLLPRRDLPGGAVVEDPPNNAGDASNVGSIPGSEISSGVGNSIPLQYSCLENSVDRGTWQPDMTERTYARTHTHTHTLPRRKGIPSPRLPFALPVLSAAHSVLLLSRIQLHLPQERLEAVGLFAIF